VAAIYMALGVGGCYNLTPMTFLWTPYRMPDMK
jgi:hypothetical protein